MRDGGELGLHRGVQLARVGSQPVVRHFKNIRTQRAAQLGRQRLLRVRFDIGRQQDGAAAEGDVFDHRAVVDARVRVLPLIKANRRAAEIHLVHVVQDFNRHAPGGQLFMNDRHIVRAFAVVALKERGLQKFAHVYRVEHHFIALHMVAVRVREHRVVEMRNPQLAQIIHNAVGFGIVARIDHHRQLALAQQDAVGAGHVDQMHLERRVRVGGSRFFRRGGRFLFGGFRRRFGGFSFGGIAEKKNVLLAQRRAGQKQDGKQQTDHPDKSFHMYLANSRICESYHNFPENAKIKRKLISLQNASLLFKRRLRYNASRN